VTRMQPARSIAASAVVVGALALSGCSAQNYAWGLEEGDVIGTWSNPGASGTELEISADGTFQATSWPSNLNCVGPMPEDAQAMHDSPTKNLTGTWSFDAGDRDDSSSYNILASLTLNVDHGCDPGSDNPMAYFTTSRSGVLSICFPLDVDPDSFTSTRTLGFLEVPDDLGSDNEMCRVHG